MCVALRLKDFTNASDKDGERYVSAARSPPLLKRNHAAIRYCMLPSSKMAPRRNDSLSFTRTNTVHTIATTIQF
ncbi:hypothetical protein HETIRDRAFT_157582 [Heterobasidion irregulare TC 32-1]|uniref:Uncharacterized protein n=1 Tax=Heterobasidion irregulare (strain TC 32-1) TaxID=747525 RepID=W4JR03_HETIT|nr:uncharacterized protein HETIRDRAFT_157582 [Heterobasidion irregulare TC 32-1]ETW75296.1 hypothetical protein HETIRDRAFT_157582 [Heterobasidion irregulare TC 32-1]